MSVEIIVAIVSFIILFALWVVVPTFIKKRHAVEVETEE